MLGPSLRLVSQPLASFETNGFLLLNGAFNETLDVAINLGIDSNKTDQNVRGMITLPKDVTEQFIAKRLETIEEVCKHSDFVSVNCPATKETFHLINESRLNLMKDTAFLINTARGDIVDDDALIDALNRRKIYAVGLDVYKNEPDLNPGYYKIKTAFILPHLGSATKDTRIAMANLAIDNIDEFFNTKFR